MRDMTIKPAFPLNLIFTGVFRMRVQLRRHRWRWNRIFLCRRDSEPAAPRAYCVGRSYGVVLPRPDLQLHGAADAQGLECADGILVS